MIKKLSLLPVSHYLLIVILGLLAYSNSFQVPFIFDDLSSITDNPVIRDLANFLPGGAGYQYTPRRSVAYLSFALNYSWGGYEVAGYHLFNLAVHLLTGFLVYALVHLTFRTPQLAQSRLRPHSRSAALLTALVFVLHPVQTQAVTYIVQRITTLSALFYLLALVLYAAARLHFEERNGPESPRHSAHRSFLLLIGAVVAAVLAMKTKEVSFTLPLAVLLYEFSFFRGAWKQRLFYVLPLLLTLPIIPIAVLGGEEGSLGGASGADAQMRVHTDMPRMHYLFTQFRVIVTYLRLLILPVDQNLEYDYPVFTRFFTFPVSLSFLLLAAVLCLGLYLHFRSSAARSTTIGREPALRLVSFGIFWFFLTLSVESTLVPLNDVIFEHRLYLPSFGPAAAFGVLTLLASLASPAFLRGRIPFFAAGILIVAFSVATYQRNSVWASSVSIWEDVVRKSPEKVRSLYNLGFYLAEAGRVEESVRVLTKAVTLDPKHADAWHNLGLAHLMADRPAEAVRSLRTAVRLKPEMDNAVVNLSAALLRAGKPMEAVPLLERILDRFPQWIDARANLCVAYLDLGDYAEAERQIAALQRLAPHEALPLAQRLNRTLLDSALQ